MYKDKIIGYFKETIPRLHKKFDTNHSSEIDELAEYVTKIYIILEKVINNPNQKLISSIEYNIAILLWRGTNTIIASFELIRGGYGFEPLIVARNALETCATAIDLYKNPNKYIEFTEKRYKSTNSISEAKKILPVIGQFYGILSNYYTHVGFSTSYPQYYKDETGTIVLITGGMYGTENQYYLNLSLSLVQTLLSIYLASTEYLFFRFCEKIEFWQKTDGNKLKFGASSEEINRQIRRIQKMIKAYSSLDKI